ncbi:hypothetical protein [Bacillus solitudinis]|uniref:hypothetical protein n=1 Tax=Bacillus solitudinis TaxID=2014074 RepID=UPI0012FD7C67|nr:hypothetical protein [Bacillus solitudinis]
MKCPFCGSENQKIHKTLLSTIDITTGQRIPVEMCEDCVVITVELLRGEHRNEFEDAI